MDPNLAEFPPENVVHVSEEKRKLAESFKSLDYARKLFILPLLPIFQSKTPKIPFLEFPSIQLDSIPDIQNFDIFSNVMQHAQLGLKSQLHVPYCRNCYPNMTQCNHLPSWYDPDLALSMSPYVLNGITVFTKDSLLDSIDNGIHIFTANNVRIKVGNASAGKGQYVVQLPMQYNAEHHLLQFIDTIHDNDWQYGIVIEENIDIADTQRSVSFSALTFPTTAPAHKFYSIGTIVEYSDDTDSTNDNVIPHSYSGTTCVIFQDLVDLKSEYSIDDPLFGHVSIVDIQKLFSVGCQVADLYKLYVKGHLARINFDFVFCRGEYKIIDTSLRLGGNSTCEFLGASMIVNDDSIMAFVSTRTVYSKKSLMDYIEHWTDHEIIHINDDPWFCNLIAVHDNDSSIV